MPNVKHENNTTIITPTKEEEELMNQKILQLGASKINAVTAAEEEDQSVINRKLYNLVNYLARGYRPGYDSSYDNNTAADNLPTIKQLGGAASASVDNQEEESSKVMKLFNLVQMVGLGHRFPS